MLRNSNYGRPTRPVGYPSQRRKETYRRYPEEQYDQYNRYDQYDEYDYGDGYENSAYQNAHGDDRARYESPVQQAAKKANPDDEAILEEIDRIKAETKSLRQLLADRKVQLDKVEGSLTKTQAETNAMVLKVANALADLSKQLEETEDKLQDAMDATKDDIAEEVARANKPIGDEFRSVKAELTKNLDTVRVDVQAAGDKVDVMGKTVGEIAEKLDDKAEKKSVIAIHKRLTTMFAVGVANMVGTILTLGLLCYLIMALAQ